MIKRDWLNKMASLPCILVLTSLMISGSVLAAELSQYTATRVQKAHQLQQDEKLKQAIELLADLKINRAYDIAYIDRMLGVFYWQGENTTAAIKHLQSAVKSGLLEDQQAWQTRRMLADVLLTEERFEQALPHYYLLTESVPETQKAEELWLRIVQSHYQLEQWQSALKGIKQYEVYNVEDTLTPLSLKLGAQLQLKQWQGASVTVERLIVLQPDKVNWWRQLASLHLQLQNSQAALDTLALARLQGVQLSQQDLHLLSQLYGQLGIPERAALVLSQLDLANSDLDLLVEQAINWQHAKEWSKAMQIWQLAAQQQPQYYWQQAQLLVQEGHYEKALVTLDKVPEKHKQVEVSLAKVRSLYKLNEIESALIEAKNANSIKPSNEAKGWVEYLSQLRQMSDSQAS
ncbi:MAG: tetratricopeptide repeat protein [Psychromonas sp.]